MPAAFGDAGRPIDAGAAPVVVSVPYGPTPIDGPLFVADRAYRVLKANMRVLVTAASATVVLKKAPSGTAAASGTALTGSGALDATTNTNVALALTATTADLSLAAGDAICADYTGTTTNATGCITVTLLPM